MDTFWVIPIRWHSSFINFDMNLGSLSLMILDGNPNLGKICRKNSSATPSAIIVSLQGIAERARKRVRKFRGAERGIVLGRRL